MAAQLTLPDGRNLGYSVAGSSDGFPLVFLHGTPGSRANLRSFEAACKIKGLKVITLDRAGYGDSTRVKGRKIVDAVSDIQALLAHLAIRQCIVVGWSGGGPHALACAARLSGCLGAIVVAGVGPYGEEGLDFLAGQGEDNHKEFGAAFEGLEALEAFLAPKREEELTLSADGMREMMSKSSLMPDVDQSVVMNSEDMVDYLIDQIHGGLKVSVAGWADDDIAFITPWGFDLGEVKVPVLLYHGEADQAAPFAHGKFVAEHLPADVVRKNFQSGEGHVSIFTKNMDKILDEVVELCRSA